MLEFGVSHYSRQNKEVDYTLTHVMIIDHNHADNNNASTPMNVFPTTICAKLHNWSLN